MVVVIVVGVVAAVAVVVAVVVVCILLLPLCRCIKIEFPELKAPPSGLNIIGVGACLQPPVHFHGFARSGAD